MSLVAACPLAIYSEPFMRLYLGEEFKGVADAKMKEINAAYEHFKRRGGER